MTASVRDLSAKRWRVALVVPALELGGGVPAVADFVYRAAERDGRFDLQLISLSSASRDELGLAFTRPSSWIARKHIDFSREWRGRPYIRVGARFSELEFQRFRPRKELSQLLGSVDLIQVVSGSPAWAVSVLGLGKPVSLQVATRAMVERKSRESTTRSLKDLWRIAMTRVTNSFEDRSITDVDSIQVENYWMLEYCRGIRDSIRCIDVQYAPPGIDTQLFCPSPAQRKESDPYILCVGRLDDPRKNIGLLLDAFILFPRSLSHVRLITAGAAPPPRSYWERVSALGLEARVLHIPQPETSELIRLYQRATVFALPSDEEGLGMVVLEAMACGVPVVATRSGGPDSVLTDGEDGYLVDTHDSRGLAGRLIELSTNGALNAQIGASARLKVESRFSDDVAGTRFMQIWERLLTKGARLQSCAG